MAFIQGIDVCGTGTGRHVMKNSFPENYTRFGGFLLKRPKNPYYSTYDTRLESFREHNWPPGMPQKPEQLAEAGFYYLGNGDQVLCFSCDGGLKNWDPEDEPWTEHAKWFEQCHFLNLKKSAEFIQRAKNPTESLKTSSAPLPQSSGMLPSTATTPQREYLAEAGSRINSLPKTETTTIPQTESGYNSAASDEGIEEPKDDHFSKGSQDIDDIEDRRDDDGGVETKMLREENERLREEISCRVCYTKESNIVFLPCRHLVTCPDCADGVQKCPVCRAEIQHMVKIFKS